MFGKKLLFLFGITVGLLAVTFFVAQFSGKDAEDDSSEKIRIVTSFYPMYVLAENLMDGVEGTSITNLTENHAGCLHDYQLTTKDMRLLSTADIFIANGAGMELFLSDVLLGQEKLYVMEASKGIELLEGGAHVHEHAHAEAEQEQSTTLEHSHEHEENGHVWLDVERYRAQARNVAEEMMLYDAEQAEAYRRALETYDAKLEALCEEAKQLGGIAKGIPVVAFHEGFAYFAQSLGMELVMSFSLDEDTVPSAGEIAEAIEEIREHGFALILIEEMYAGHAKKLLEQTNAMVVYLDPLTGGDGSKDSYLIGMRSNYEAVWEALQKEAVNETKK